MQRGYVKVSRLAEETHLNVIFSAGKKIMLVQEWRDLFVSYCLYWCHCNCNAPRQGPQHIKACIELNSFRLLPLTLQPAGGVRFSQLGIHQTTHCSGHLCHDIHWNQSATRSSHCQSSCTWASVSLQQTEHNGARAAWLFLHVSKIR